MNFSRLLTKGALAMVSASILSACGGGGTSRTAPIGANESLVTYSVGRASIEWTDNTRDEMCGSQPTGTKRRLQAYVWYPADPTSGATKAPLLTDAQVTYLAQLQDAPSEVLSSLPSNSFSDAPVAKRNATYPVLLMSHGGGGASPLQYASTAEALASKGYIVLGLSHPYQSVATFYANGDVTPMDPACDPGGAPTEITETSTYEDFTANWQYTVQLDAYISGDFSSALAHLLSLNNGTGMFAKRMELARVGALGHSFGGSHAYRAARNIPEIVAAANIDGTVFSAEYGQGAGAGKALLTMIAGEGSGTSVEADLAAQIAQLQDMGLSPEQATEVANRGRAQSAFAASTPAYLVSIPTAKHLNFTDAGLWNDHGIPSDPVGLNLQSAKAILDLQNKILIDFFDKHVRQRQLDLGIPATSLPGVRIESRN